MKLLFKQRFFTWFDSYDIYDESGATLFTVEGQLGWGHTLHINDAKGEHIATLKQRLFTFLPKFDLYIGEDLDVLLELCDRILVLCAGKVSGIVEGRKAKKEEVGLLMTHLGEEVANENA